MERIVGLMKQYRYGILILLLGVGLMLTPTGETDETIPQSAAVSANELSVEEKLADILSRMEGVGKTEVMLTYSMGEETVYETREDSSISDSSENLSREPVIITDSGRAEQGLVRQVVPAVFRGAIVVCQGGGSPAVRLAIVEAVSNVTGLTADKITVLKMK